MKQISFIIGSGFSVPDGMKTVGQINEILSNMTLEDIYIHSDMTIHLTGGQKESGPSFHWSDETFFIELIQFYMGEHDGIFDYERFYDYLTSFTRYEKHQKKLEHFFADLNRDVLKLDSSIDNLQSYISRFSSYYNMLISSLLQSKKYYENVGLGNYPPYDAFCIFLKKIIENGTIIHVHSLNHDILFEHIASKYLDLWQHFSDGYSDQCSPYYGQVHLEQSITKNYRVRLKRFTNEYLKPLRLYKIHGSVDTYIADVSMPEIDYTRVKRDWGVGGIQKETQDEDGNFSYTQLFQNTYPDMLSGASSKALWYKEPYYKDLLSHFKTNLNSSEILIVIGYGFGDEGINHIVETEYLLSGKQMFVIDIKNPNSRLVDDYKTQLIEQSLTKLTIDNWMVIISHSTVKD